MGRAFYGQDAQYHGPAFALQDNGDGTVSDLNTGLMWQQDDDGVTRNWQDALAHAEDQTIAGYSDWRLPTNKELQSIVDYTHSPNAVDPEDLGPAIDTSFFGISELPLGTTLYDPDYGYFWSSTNAYHSLVEPEHYYGWYVAFGTAVDDINQTGEDMHGAGAVRFDAKTEGAPLEERIFNCVRCVRGGLVESPVPDIKANGLDGPITVSTSDPISLTIELDRGAFGLVNADWWIVARTPFGIYSYVEPTGWTPGIERASAEPIVNLPAYEFFNDVGRAGKYTIYFALDGNVDGTLDGTWFDAVAVQVQ